MAKEKPLPRLDGQGIIDMHVHIGPEFIRRRYSPQSLAEEARREGIGVVMKNHFQPTTGWVSMLRRDDDEVALIGCTVLNVGAGGIDEHGVRAALSGWKRDVTAGAPDSERFVVWMPTICAESHLAIMGRFDIPLTWGVDEKHCRHFPPGEGLTIFDAEGRVSEGLRRALAMIAEQDLILASGHLSREETKVLAREAHGAGVRRLVLTHPLFHATELEADELRHLWEAYGAYSEFCFVNLAMDDLGTGRYVDTIRAVGTEGCILSSDVGQTFSPTVSDAMRQYFAMLQGEGVSEDEIIQMSIINPRRIID